MMTERQKETWSAVLLTARVVGLILGGALALASRPVLVLHYRNSVSCFYPLSAVYVCPLAPGRAAPPGPPAPPSIAHACSYPFC